jgi:hypothetical protein
VSRAIYREIKFIFQSVENSRREREKAVLKNSHEVGLQRFEIHAAVIFKVFKILPCCG